MQGEAKRDSYRVEGRLRESERDTERQVQGEAKRDSYRVEGRLRESERDTERQVKQEKRETHREK